MRYVIACLSALTALALCGCGVPFAEPAGVLLAASAAAVPVFGRSVPDIAYSAITGRDCSVVRLDQGKSYCRTVDPPITPSPVCTRSLANVECWSNPEAFSNPQHGIADAPVPTAEQEAYRTRSWPAL